MKNVLICQYEGSANHGSEALVRTSIQILLAADPKTRIELYSLGRADDEKYLSDLNELRISGPRESPGKFSLRKLFYHLLKRLRPDENATTLPLSEEFRRAVAGADVVVSIGGDNYGDKHAESYFAHDRYIKEQGKPYVLLGLSADPADLPLMLARHLQLFDFITVRESLSYQALCDNDLTNVALCPDPAFLLPAEQTRLPNGFMRGNTVGINISPQIMAQEQQKGIMMDNFRVLLKYILGNTRMQIALIPHSLSPGNDDRLAIEALKQEFADNNRIITVSDMGARELKYIISQLRFFLGARTHAMIAAYSSQIPALTLDSSIKARGIALDLFDSAENYVLPVGQITDSQQLMQAFIWLMEHEQQIKQRLSDMIPAYQGLASGASLYLQRILAGKKLLIPGAPLLPSKSRCVGCGLCAQVCGYGAISLETDEEGFVYPRTDAELCQKCGLCGRVCPVQQAPPAQATTAQATTAQATTAQAASEQAQPTAYAAKLLDKKIRRVSSAGGVFTPLALDLLRHGGYVCGAAYDNDLNVRHIIIDDERDLSRLRGAKYGQSDLREVYGPIRQILEAQRPLLFCGTPCQTAAIRTWCGDHDYLLTVALACHGVPSALVFRKYLGELEKKQGLRAVDVDFSNKAMGWPQTHTRVQFGGGSHYDEPNSQSPYMRAFTGNLCLRPACHNCFAKPSITADLLIGDYRGIGKHQPDFADDLGVSLILTLSEKGCAAFDGIRGQLELRPSSKAEACLDNPAIISPAPYNPRRNEFFRLLQEKPLAELADSILAEDQDGKLKKGLKKLLG